MYKQEGYNLVGAAIEVYNTLGHGFLEEVYQECLEIELRLRDVPFQSYPKLTLSYKSKQLEKYYIPDLYVYDDIVVELKAQIAAVRNVRQRGDFMATKDVLTAIYPQEPKG